MWRANVVFKLANFNPVWQGLITTISYLSTSSCPIAPSKSRNFTWGVKILPNDNDRSYKVELSLKADSSLSTASITSHHGFYPFIWFVHWSPMYLFFSSKTMLLLYFYTSVYSIRNPRFHTIWSLAPLHWIHWCLKIF